MDEFGDEFGEAMEADEVDIGDVDGDKSGCCKNTSKLGAKLL